MELDDQHLGRNGCEKDKERSFQFVEPHSVSRGTLLQRKQSICDDNISVLSYSGENYAKPNKKRRLSRMNSFADFLSPAKQLKKVGGMITRAKSTANIPELGSIDGVEFASPSIRSNSLRSSAKPKDGEFSLSPSIRASTSNSFTSSLSRKRLPSMRKKATHESMKRGRSWIEKFSEDKRPSIAADMSYWELKRQEAIYELYKGEKYLVKDLELVVQAYKKSLICLKILDSSEAESIFGPIDILLPLHRELKNKIKEVRNSDTKTVNAVGDLLHHWVGSLEVVYIPYLTNQALAKQMLDSKKANCKDLQVFLDLCIQSDFSRRLDLWNFLDVPRSKLMKYPLLLKSILKQTPEGHDDKDFLPDVISKIEQVIKSVDKRTGESNCKHLLQKLQFSDEKQREPFLYNAKTILCEGELKNNRGTKLYGFLFDSGFLLTRLIEETGSSSFGVRYKAHKQPISAFNLHSQEVKDGENRNGSFKSFSFSSSGKNTFQVSSKNKSECFTLSASSEHDKQEWLLRLKEVEEACETDSSRSSTLTTFEEPKIKTEDVTPSNKGDVTPSNKGDVTPSNKGDVTPSNKGDVTPSNKGDVTPSNKGDVTPSNKGDVTPSNKGDVTPSNKGDVTPSNKGDVTPSNKGDVTPSNKGDVTPSNKGDVTPSNKGDVTPSNKGDVTPSNKGDVTPSNKGDVTPSNKGDVTPSNKGDVTPSNKREILDSGKISKANIPDLNVTPKNSGFKISLRSCTSLLKQKSFKGQDAPVNAKRQRLSSSKKALKEQNFSPVC